MLENCIDNVKIMLMVIDFKGFLGPFLFLIAGLSTFHVTRSLDRIKGTYGISGVFAALMTSIIFSWWSLLYGSIALVTGTLYCPGGHMILGVEAVSGGLLLMMTGAALHLILFRKIQEMGDVYTENIVMA